MTPAAPLDGTTRARLWLDHLRDGGTTAWSQFEPGPDDRVLQPSREPIPGAIQLELLRRINAAGPPGAASRALVDRVLSSSPPGRGMPDLELLGVHGGSTFGPRPVDPGELPIEELIRLAVGVLAEQVVDQASAAVPEPPERRPLRSRRWARPWRRSVSFDGDPWRSAGLIAARQAAGMTPGLRPPEVLVLADDLPTWLWRTWSWRVVGHARPVSWEWWLDRWLGRSALPPLVDLPAILRRRRRELPAANVHVVCGPVPDALPNALLGRQGMAGEIPAPHLLPAPFAGPDSAAMAVHAQTNAVLRVMEPEHRLPDLSLGVLRPILAEVSVPPGQSGSQSGSQPSSQPGSIPERYREFLQAQGRGMSELLGQGHYPVHGDPTLLEDVSSGSRQRENAVESNVGVLDVAIRALRSGDPA